MSTIWIWRSRCVLGPLFAAGLAACAASSRPEIPVEAKGFLGGIASYDRNGDSIVTCDEWRAAALELFTKADRTGAGFLADAEFQSLAKIDRTFQTAGSKHFDANGDGKVEKSEFTDRPNPAFAFADKDKDCRLTSLELQVARNLADPPAPAGPPAGAGPGGQGGPPGR